MKVRFRSTIPTPLLTTTADLLNLDNAIPIEGWISDPSDKELLVLIPLLEALQYCTDVRAMLALRHGQASPA